MDERRNVPFTDEGCCLESVGQQASSASYGSQSIDQLNFNKQILALAYAESYSTAIAEQRANQMNNNESGGTSNTANSISIDGGYNEDYQSSQCCDDINQKASSIIGQTQHVEQDNANIQEGAIVKGNCLGRLESIEQYSENLNKNAQNAFAKAINFEGAGKESDQAEDAGPEKGKDENNVLYPDRDDTSNKITGVNAKLQVTVNYGGREMTLDADGEGRVTYDEKEADDNQELEASTAQDSCSIKMELVLDGQPYEISVDEDNNVLVNGQKINF